MRFHVVVRTVGELREALEGLDPDAPVVWRHAIDPAMGDQCEATVDTSPAAAFITVHGPGEGWW